MQLLNIILLLTIGRSHVKTCKMITLSPSHYCLLQSWLCASVLSAYTICACVICMKKSMVLSLVLKDVFWRWLINMACEHICTKDIYSSTTFCLYTGNLQIDNWYWNCCGKRLHNVPSTKYFVLCYGSYSIILKHRNRRVWESFWDSNNGHSISFRVNVISKHENGDSSSY